jgi:catechol 2,3-dioxygenase-like lactoylglutathione lyase family enzyme
VFRDPQVNTYVRDVEACVRFYTESLGFVETFRTPESGSPAHVEVRLGGLILGFADVEATRQMHGLDVAAGATPLSPPHDFIGRLRAAWIADPDGGPVQLVMEVDPSVSPS